MKTKLPDLSQMNSQEVSSQRIRIDGQQILFDTKVKLLPTQLEKDENHG